MKTSVTLHSPDRELFGIRIRQETKSGFLSLTDLQNAYSIARQSLGWSDKQIQDIIQQKENSERIYYILKKQRVINTDFPVFMEQVENQGLLKVLKSAGAYRVSGARKSKATWCNPYIWVLIAMELNPMIYAETVMWLTDSLLVSRIEAGNFYKDLSAAVSKFPECDYARIAKAFNHVVFGKHETGIRQRATASQLNELAELEKKMAWAIDMGYIKSQHSLLVELKKTMDKKYDHQFLKAA